MPNTNVKSHDRISTALNLPIVATYNLRSLLPKINNLKDDIIEREVDLAFLQEIWEKPGDKVMQLEAEKMLQLDGLTYISAPRPKNRRGISYGGAAIIVNIKKFFCEKLPIHVPSGLEIVWGLLKSKDRTAKYQKIIVCSFYSPPDKGKNTKLSNHISSSLHMLASKYPESGIILGADKNGMNINPILNCGLKLRQVVEYPTHGHKILDIIIMNLASFYKSPFIAPPIDADDPDAGEPSDHSVPVCIPHTNKYERPKRVYRIINYRPLPQSSLQKFGQWIVTEEWKSIDALDCPSSQAEALDNILMQKLNLYCPIKQIKLSSQDKPYITSDIKKISRQKMREYTKHGKTDKYFNLKYDLKNRLKNASSKFVNNSVEALKLTKPGQFYKMLKKLGAQPGECVDSVFTLPAHEEKKLTSEQSAEKIAEHFASISNEFPPLSENLLPPRVKSKLELPGKAPVVSEIDVYQQIIAAKKTKSGTVSDLPNNVIKEFAVELSAPLSKLINKIFSTGHWPSHWKMEQVTPIPKVPMPETEEDLRPIALTPFFSKVAEHFVVRWLLDHIGGQLDFRQYGGLKGNSISHYIIEFVTFILSAQDSSDQTAILACLVDFSKAFSRQNHHIIITKLSDMNVPGWLLKIVMAFLSDRKMVVKYKGTFSSIKSLPGGGPQGTILALILFLVLINDAGFEGQENNLGEIVTSKRNMRKANEIHLKFVDDLTIAEAIDLKKQLVKLPEESRVQPDTYHARTGHVLPLQNSRVHSQLSDLQKFSVENEMVMNLSKTKSILFNPCQNIDFVPELKIDDKTIDVVEEVKLLGLTIRSDLKWTSNTKNIVFKANRRLWILRRLKGLGVSVPNLVDVFQKQVRSTLELGVPAWQGAISKSERQSIERVQRYAAHIILGEQYTSYSNALNILGLETLEERRVKLSLKFALRAEKSSKFKAWFRRVSKNINTRQKTKYYEVVAKHDRFARSPLSYLTKLLNAHYRNK